MSFTIDAAIHIQTHPLEGKNKPWIVEGVNSVLSRVQSEHFA